MGVVDGSGPLVLGSIGGLGKENVVSVQCLGHVSNAEGLHATDDKRKVIVSAPHLKTVAELRSFMGLHSL